jgi:glycosyltransferase involved in cell wall biosynthesis
MLINPPPEPAVSGVEEPSVQGEGAVFSVLIAAYNHSAYIEETLESVARQRWEDYELVVVDDGSTDDTAQKVTAWMEGYRRCRPNRAVLTRISNRGQSAALEHGFGECRGRYICLLDSDDRWLPEKLSEVYRTAAAHPAAGMIIHPLYVIGPSGVRTGDVRPKLARLTDGDCRDLVRRTGRHVAPGTSGVVIRRDIFGQLLPMPTRRFSFGADAYLTFGAMLLAPVRALPIPLAEYRVHEDGQYVRRMLSVEGLTRGIELQQTIAAHFGIDAALRHNSFFLRNRFALSKLQDTLPSQIAAFSDLIRATTSDHGFPWSARLALLAYWSLCMAVPRPAFLWLWTVFQRRQTGLGKKT